MRGGRSLVFPQHRRDSPCVVDAAQLDEFPSAAGVRLSAHRPTLLVERVTTRDVVERRRPGVDLTLVELRQRAVAEHRRPRRNELVDRPRLDGRRRYPRDPRFRNEQSAERFGREAASATVVERRVEGADHFVDGGAHGLCWRELARTSTSPRQRATRILRSMERRAREPMTRSDPYCRLGGMTVSIREPASLQECLTAAF